MSPVAPPASPDQPATPRPAAARSRITGIGIALIVVATLGIYFFVGLGAAERLPPFGKKGDRAQDYFNLLSHGFLNGHLYLICPAPPELARLANPYDPVQREGIPVLHDASYYRGRYYIYFGPAPVVTLFLPFTALTGRDLPMAWAIWLFSSIGYLALLGIFFQVQRRHFAAASAATQVSAALALGLGTLLLAVLRRSALWEVPVSAGFCFFALSLLCLVRALYAQRTIAWAAAGGLALGLAVASRPTYLACAPLFALPLWLRRNQPTVGRGYRWGALLAAGAACGAIGVALAVYNFARFGDPLEFGMTYQLSGMGEVGRRHFSPLFVPINVRLYFLSALGATDAFPFLTSVPTPDLPAGYGGHEYSFGLFRNLPFSWFGLVALAGLASGRLRPGHGAEARPALGLIATAVVLTSVLPLLFFGSCLRYMADFAPSFMLLAAVGLLLGEAHLRHPLALFGLRAAGLVLALITSAVAFLAVVNLYSPAPDVPPAGFRPLARLTNAPLFALREQRWPHYGPTELTLSFPENRTRREEPIFVISPAGRETAQVFVDYVSERTVRFGYREHTREHQPIFSSVVPAEPGTRHVLRLAVGGPYADYNGTKALLRGQFDAQALWSRPIVSINVFPGDMRFGESSAPMQPPARFSGVIHATRPISLRDIGGHYPRGVRVRFTASSGMFGHSLPIVATGATGAADVCFLRVRANGQATFGYDHWGDGGPDSNEFTLRPGDTITADLWMPSMSPGDRGSTLVVRLNGAAFWRAAVPFYETQPETTLFGSNLIGASSCETTFDQALFESLLEGPTDK